MKKRGFWGALWDNIYVCITGRFRDEETDLNKLWDIGFVRFARREAAPFLKKAPKLTREQKKQVKKFYAPYKRVTTLYHRIYTAEYGVFQPEYLPDDLFYTDIDRFYNDREEARYLDNKCYYPQIFQNILQPKMVAMRCGCNWLDDERNFLSISDVISRIQMEEEVILKKAVNSEGGARIRFLAGDTPEPELRKCLEEIDYDIVIQRVIKQHAELARLHESSVNTMRLISILSEQEVKVYAAMIRIGVGSSRIDNTSAGALLCVIDNKGRLAKKGYLDAGYSVTKHPELGYSFEEIQIPQHVKKAVHLVKKAHPCVPHFRMVSWDIAINEEGEAVLIEANLSLGGIANTQCAMGPVFGKDTRKILEEVYQKKRV